jgi:aryl-alcohol dehydrogenase-like predicted oxidoreductase
MQHSSSSRITIGGGRFTHLEQKKVSKLVDLAFELGIRRIDTAPSYPESEKKIGQAIKGFKDFQITTKVRPAPGVTLNADAIKKSVQKSLIDLGLDEVECIYLHSVSPQHCDDSVFSSLVELKEAGVTKQIGVCADNDELGYYFQLGTFDQFMASFSILDQSNKKTIELIRKDDESRLTIKRSVANGVWRSDIKASALNLYRSLRKEKDHSELLSYRNRHLEMSKELGIRLTGLDYMQFIFSEFKSANILIGTNSPEHLEQFRKVEELPALNLELHEQIRNVFEKKVKKQWSALI